MRRAMSSAHSSAKLGPQFGSSASTTFEGFIISSLQTRSSTTFDGENPAQVQSKKSRRVVECQPVRTPNSDITRESSTPTHFPCLHPTKEYRSVASNVQCASYLPQNRKPHICLIYSFYLIWTHKDQSGSHHPEACTSTGHHQNTRNCSIHCCTES